MRARWACRLRNRKPLIYRELNEVNVVKNGALRRRVDLTNENSAALNPPAADSKCREPMTAPHPALSLKEEDTWKRPLTRNAGTKPPCHMCLHTAKVKIQPFSHVPAGFKRGFTRRRRQEGKKTTYPSFLSFSLTYLRAALLSRPSFLSSHRAFSAVPRSACGSYP